MSTETTTYNPYQLSSMADCYDPDSTTSPGARFLERIADAFRESYTYDPDTTPDSFRDDGSAHEVADGAVPIYTHERWQVFADLGAYNEDPTELGVEDASDLTGVKVHVAVGPSRA